MTFKAKEIYPDDLLIKNKSKIKEDYGLELTFERLCEYDLLQVK
jgi:hypothetical protein